MGEPAGRVAAAGYGRGIRRICAVLIDIDGMLTVSWQPLPGAVAALARLRADRYPVALVTNTTSRSGEKRSFTNQVQPGLRAVTAG